MIQHNITLHYITFHYYTLYYITSYYIKRHFYLGFSLAGVGDDLNVQHSEGQYVLQF